MALVVKNFPENAGGVRDKGSISGSERALGVESDNQSSILAQKITWTEGPGGLPSMGSHRVRHS